MNHEKFEVVLATSSAFNHTYYITAGTEIEAIILAQAKAILMARGFDFVSVEKVKQ